MNASGCNHLGPWAYIAGGAVIAAIYYLIPGGHGGHLVGVKVAFYCLLSVSAVVAISVGVIRFRPDNRAPWLLLLLSQAVYAAGDITFYVRHDLLKITAYPSISDVLYVLHYPLLVIGLVWMIRSRSRGCRSAGPYRHGCRGNGGRSPFMDLRYCP